MSDRAFVVWISLSNIRKRQRRCIPNATVHRCATCGREPPAFSTCRVVTLYQSSIFLTPKVLCKEDIVLRADGACTAHRRRRRIAAEKGHPFKGIVLVSYLLVLLDIIAYHSVCFASSSTDKRKKKKSKVLNILTKSKLKQMSD
jgi:hypothetical protein